MNPDLVAQVRRLMNTALADMQESCAWYVYIVEPIYLRHRIPIDGDFHRRRWWFVLRDIR